MERENLFNLYVEAYFGVREMDEYDLKEYVLKDIENYIKDFVYTNDIDINMDLLSSIGLDSVKEEPKVEPITDTPVDLNIDLTLPTDVENTNSLNAETKDEEPLVNLGEDLPNINEPAIDEPKIEDIKPSIDLSDLASFSNVTELNTNKGTKITKTDIVSDEKVSQIFSSRGIIPIVYDYLENQSKVGA